MTITWLLTYLTAVVAIVMTQRGLWGLMDEYLWPKNPKRSYWTSFIKGFVIIVAVLAIIQP